MKPHIQAIQNQLSDLYIRIEKNRREAQRITKTKTNALELIIDYLNDGLSETIHPRSMGNETTLLFGSKQNHYESLLVQQVPYGALNKQKQYKLHWASIKEHFFEQERASQKRMAGVIFDGQHILFCHNTDQEPPQKKKFSQETLYEWIVYILGTIKKNISGMALQQDFSTQKTTGANFVVLLYNQLLHTTDEHIQSLYRGWKSEFVHNHGHVLSNLHFSDIKKHLASATIQLDAHNPSTEGLLFCLYTYYALLMTFFAADICCLHHKILPQTASRYIQNNGDFAKNLFLLESGALFYEIAYIQNYCTEDYFSWYLYTLTNETKTAIKDLLTKIQEYDFVYTLSQEDSSKDVFKRLYEHIIPQKIRHVLGEYYTPNWLAQITVQESGFLGSKSHKVLDPSCGSGAFVLECINVIKRNRTPHQGSKIQYICSRVIGFDINPVAVLTARSNYLMAISPYLSDEDKPIEIPIYLTDALLTPSLTQSKQKRSGYEIHTSEGRFFIPLSLVHNNYIPKIAQHAQLSIIEKHSVQEFCSSLLQKKYALDDFEQEKICIVYEQMQQKEATQSSQFLFQYISNALIPETHRDCTHIVGNPPWIKWDALSTEYKKKLDSLCLHHYKMFSHKGMKASLGYAHDDISILFSYIVLDKYLIQEGTLSFVLKQTLFKSIAGDQFRKFLIEKKKESIPIQCVCVHDMLAVNPFGQGQETSVVTLTKNRSTKYPIPYHIWKKTTKKRLSENDTAQQIYEMCTKWEQDAYPDPTNNIHTAPWITIPKGLPIPRLSGIENHYTPRHGVVNDLNGLFLVDVIKKINDSVVEVKNQGDKGKKKIKVIQQCIEHNMIFPLLKPKDIRKWGIYTHQYMLVPQKKAGENNVIEMQTHYPKTYQFFVSFQKELATRKSKWFYGGDKPFYSLFGIGEYTFQKYKVVWCCMSYQPFFSVVSEAKDPFIGVKTYIPDNTIGYISVDTEQEAHYICALLNAQKTEALFALKSSKSKWGISIEMVKQVPIQQFDTNNPHHLALVDLSLRAHKTIEHDEIALIESAINTIIQQHTVFYE